MPTRVLSGPEPIVTPVDIVGEHASDDPKIIALIAAVQAEIDGPSGWLGRALGKQKLEFTAASFPCRDPIECHNFQLYPVVIPGSILMTYRDEDGVEQTIGPENYRLVGDRYVDFVRGYRIPPTECAPDAVKLVYEAGYNGTAIADGGTGNVPPNAKAAVVLGVQQMKAISAENLFLRSEEVEGVGTFQYTVSEQASSIISKAADRLLNGLRVYS